MPIADKRVSIMAVIEETKASDNHHWDGIFQEAVGSWEPLAQAIQTAEKVTPTLPVTNHNWE